MQHFCRAWFCLLAAGVSHLQAADAKGDHFESLVRPVLVEKCVRCHGPEKSSGGLRLDSRKAMLQGGDSGPAIVEGKPAESLLLKAVRREKGVEAMPPDKPLKAEAVAALEQWVRDGATWPETAAPVRVERHWAFEPVRRIEAPAGLSSHPVDAFILAKLREKGLKPVHRADRLTLLRRATYDLTGLPPTPAEIEAFLEDDSADAFVKVVERLLASPHYGEKWGRHWLDVVRYADTAGETADFPVPDAWRYRNYVINAFNVDRPYDEFIAEQLAGDIIASARLMPDDRRAELITATGYLAVARRFGFDVHADHFLTLEDTIDTFGKSFLGVTIGCARCHDHKYDPITARDYYALYGIFESTRYPHPGCEKEKAPRDRVPLVPIEKVQAAVKGLPAVVGAAAGTKADSLVTRATPHAYAVWEGNPHDAHLQKRGDPNSRGEAVPRRFLTLLGGQKLPPNSGSGRLELAKWVADAANPLTARVMVNRIWAGHFGTGLVATPNDFGTRGLSPSHPELLDYLAGRFVKDGWSIKQMHRLIMLSETYQRAASVEPMNMQADPADRYLWRFPRRRLTAEEIRDTLLVVSGDLDPTPAGPHPFPDPKSWGFTQHAPFSAVYETNRRSVYLMTQRLKRHPFLALFDGPDPNASTPGRQTTIVPTQALFFLNDPFAHARAESLASRLLKLPDERSRVDQACLLLYGRPARETDRAIARRMLEGKKDDRAAYAAWLRVLFASNELVFID
jgi:cytochrome c553